MDRSQHLNAPYSLGGRGHDMTINWHLLTRQVMKTVAHSMSIQSINAKIGQMSGRLIGIAYLVVQYFE